MPDVSVNIPVYNGEKYISQSIHSVLQTKADIEILVLDDGSTDRTREVVTTIAQKDLRVRLLISDQQKGIVAARQRLFKSSDTEFFVPFDADDIMVPRWIDEAVSILRQRREIGAVYGKARFINDKSEDLMQTNGSPFSKINCYDCHPVPHGSVVARREAIIKSGGYLETSVDEVSVLEDFFLWCRVSIESEMLYVDHYTYLYRKHDSQITRQKHKFVKCMDYIQQYFLDINPELTKNIIADDFSMPQSDKEKKLAMFIIGIFLQKTKCGEKVYGSLLKRARMIDANDYGLYIKLYNHYMATQRERAAVRAANTLSEWKGIGFYPRITGHHLLSNYYQFLEDNETSEFHKIKFKEAKDQYSYFTEEMVAL